MQGKKIGIDASRAFLENATGVEVYSTEFLNHLKDLNLSEKYEFVLYYRDQIDKKIIESFPLNFTFKRLSGSKLWTMLSLSKEMKFSSPDLLFVPSHTFPVFLPRRKVITIHDIGWKHFPKSYSAKDRFYLDKSTKFAVKKADLIFTDSVSSKNDLIDFYKCPAGKIKVVYLGFQTSLNEYDINDVVEREIMKKYTLKSESYFLVVGRVEKKKNFEYALKAFGEVSKIYPDLRIVFAGNMGFGSDDFWDIARSIGIAGKITQTGYVSSKDLSILYKNAFALFYPTLFEGFGFPVLEAFNAEIPVICSKTSSIPEVAGNACLYIDPYVFEDGVEKLRLILDDKKLRKDLIKKGKERLNIFSWEKCVKESFDLMSNLL